MSEISLSGRVTPGVVRIGETVRRPVKLSTPFVRSLLAELEARGFDAAPRYLGSDEQAREKFSYLDGDVPDELEADHSDETLAAAACLIRRYHNATVGSALAGTAEVVCHNDLSPCNFVFRNGQPVALIDFDGAGPGTRLDDLGYALFLSLNLGTDGPPPHEQARRIQIFCAGYGISADEQIVTAIAAAIATNIERLCAADRLTDTKWWKEQLDWVERHRDALSG